MKQLDCYHVLIVDDEFHLRQSLRRFLEKEGSDFRVTAEAADGAQALAILKDVSVEVVITDIRMPVMDGLALTEQLHALYPRIRVIILTGYADFEYARSAVRFGAVDYLLKPFGEEDLEDALGRLRTSLQADYVLSDEVAGSSGGRESVNWAIRYMQEHYMEEVDISRIADELGFHSAYLTRLFNRYAGESPLKYLTNIRIREAKRLLAEGTLPIQAVGERVGYPDQFHFSKTFRKATGMSPSAWRRQQMESGV